MAGPSLAVSSPARGEIWTADLNPTRGREQAGTRPVLIFSDDQYNQGPSDLVVIVPLTSTMRRIPIHVEIHPPEGGLRQPSRILCDQIRCIARQRLATRWGSISAATLAEVEIRVRVVLGL